ncbi:MAG: hypothetical protein NXH97_20135 [Rhodobacteraceae bacterium]|nr:hypothetical protein [Paracoccaceae bacterium]
MQWRAQLGRFLVRLAPWTVWALAPIALALAGFFALPALVSHKLVLAQVDQQIGAWTGGTFGLRSDAEVVVQSGFRVAVIDPAVVDRADTASSPVMTADLLIAPLRILPLLLGRVEIANLVLLRPELDLGAAPKPLSANTRLHTDGAPPIEQLGARKSPLVGMTVIDGTLRFDSATNVDAISGLHLNLANEPSSGAVAIQGGLALGTQQLRINGRMDDLRALVSDAGTQGKLSVRSRPRLQAAQGDAVPVQMSGGASDEITDSARQVVRLFDLARTGFGQFVVEGTYSVTRYAVGISDATLSIGGMDLLGSVRVRALEQPVVGQLLQLPNTLNAMIAQARKLGAGDWRDAPVSLAWLDGLDIDVELSGKNLRYGNLRLEKAAVSVAVADESATIDLSAASSRLGRVQAEFSIEDAQEQSGEAVSLAGFGRVDDISVRTITQLAAATSPPPLIGTPQLPEGTMNGAFDVVTTGGSLGQIMENLGGSVTARLQDGSFAGADLVATLETLAEGREFMTEKDGPLIPAAGRTQFDRVDAQVEFASGEASLSRVQVAGERIGITILGEVQLTEGRMNVGGHAVLLSPPETGPDAAHDGPIVNMPFGVGGTVFAPVIAAGVPDVISASANDSAIDP